MTQDEIIRMARKAGFREDTNCEIYGSYYHLERFAALVAAHEREACAKVCEEGTAFTTFQSKDCYSYAHNRAMAIRGRK